MYSAVESVAYYVYLLWMSPSELLVGMKLSGLLGMCLSGHLCMSLRELLVGMRLCEHLCMSLGEILVRTSLSGHLFMSLSELLEGIRLCGHLCMNLVPENYKLYPFVSATPRVVIFFSKTIFSRSFERTKHKTQGKNHDEPHTKSSSHLGTL